MRLIGGKDYYDGVTGFDTDERRVFVRSNLAKAEARTIDQVYPYETDLVFENFKKTSRWRTESADLSHIYVIFCGVLYRGLYRSESTYNTDSQSRSTTYHCFWDATSALEELKRQECQLYDDEYRWKRYGSTIDQKRVIASTVDKFFEPQTLPQAITDILIAENIVHSIRLGNISGLKKSAFNGNMYATDYPAWYDNTDGLKTIGFARVVDPWQAYQQIDMWLGSQLAKEEDNMVQLSDNELIAKHGFDKVSFRNTHHVGKPRGRS